MAEIHASFHNTHDESRYYAILDILRDPNAPAVLYDNFIGANASTDPLTLYSAMEGGYGKIRYTAAGGSAIETWVGDGANIDLD